MRRSIITTFGSIGLTKAAQLLFPLITIPYLARTIGVESMGIVAFIQAVIAYVLIIPDLGISVFGPRWVSIHSENKVDLQRLLSNVFVLKIFASMISLFVLFVLVALIPVLNKHFLLFVLASPLILSSVFAPGWFFLGLQKMWGFSFSTLLNFLCNTILIFVFIHQPSDITLLILFGSLLSLIQIIYSLLFLKKLGLSLFRRSLFSFQYCKEIMNNSLPLFISSVFGTFYTNVFVVVLGFTATPTSVGYYSAAERVIKAGLLLFGTIGQSLYPHLSKKYSASETNVFQTLRKTAPVTVTIAFLMGTGTFMLSNLIISILYGAAFLPAANILKILSFLFVFLGINDACGMQFFIPLGLVKKQLHATTVGLISAFIVVFPLCYYFAGTGAALSYFSTEGTISVFMLFSVFAFYKKSITRSNTDSAIPECR